MSTTMTYHIEDIKRMYQEKGKLKYIFFWGHTEKGNEITKACFSQWYPCTFEINENSYFTTEQYMMAQKALLFQDKEIYQKIMEAGHPNEFKQLGRKIQHFKEEIWNEKKYEIVVEGNFAKFSQNKELGDYLIQTGSRVLVEASPYDKIWGIGMAADNEKAENPLMWKGQNLLGFALMEVRDKLKNRKE